jgi:hypothetical protein
MHKITPKKQPTIEVHVCLLPQSRQHKHLILKIYKVRLLAADITASRLKSLPSMLFKVLKDLTTIQLYDLPN